MTDDEYGPFITAGSKCPICKGYGLFAIDAGSRCENCLTYFDEQMRPVKRWTGENYEFLEVDCGDKAMKIPRCKHCGSRDTLVKGQAHGPIEMFYNETGFHFEDSWDRVYTVSSHVVRCADCLKVRRDLVCSDNVIETVEASSE